MFGINTTEHFIEAFDKLKIDDEIFTNLRKSASSFHYYAVANWDENPGYATMVGSRNNPYINVSNRPIYADNKDLELNKLNELKELNQALFPTPTAPLSVLSVSNPMYTAIKAIKAIYKK